MWVKCEAWHIMPYYNSENNTVSTSISFKQISLLTCYLVLDWFCCYYYRIICFKFDRQDPLTNFLQKTSLLSDWFISYHKCFCKTKTCFLTVVCLLTCCLIIYRFCRWYSRITSLKCDRQDCITDFGKLCHYKADSHFIITILLRYSLMPSRW